MFEQHIDVDIEHHEVKYRKDDRHIKKLSME